MPQAVREYDAKIDSKKRITLRSGLFEYYHVIEMDDGTVLLQPRELTPPFEVSANTLNMMDEAIDKMRSGSVSDPVDLSDFEE